MLIVDDHKLFAEAIRAALTEAGLEVVGVAATGRDATHLARSTHPELVLMDLGLPDDDGIRVGQDLMAEDPEVKILVVTALRDAKALKKALRVGFYGYVTKDTPVSQFVDSVRSALTGNVVVPRSMAPGAGGAQSPEEQAADLLARQLTSRELRVLGLLAEGARSEDIAERLSISVNTVRTHVQNVLTKLQVRSRLEAVAFAVRHGIVEITGEGRRVVDLTDEPSEARGPSGTSRERRRP
ncbi:MAG: response regulator [Actinomycetota bacterium]